MKSVLLNYNKKDKLYLHFLSGASFIRTLPGLWPQKKCNFQSYDKIVAGDSNWCYADQEVKTIPSLS